MQHLTSHPPSLPPVQLHSNGNPAHYTQSPDKGKLTALGESRRYEARQPIVSLIDLSSNGSSQSVSVTRVDKLQSTKSLENNPAEQLFRQFWEEGYNKRDLACIHRLCLDKIYMWGSADGEDLDGLDAVAKQFEDDWLKSEKASLNVLHRISSAPGAQWAAALCNLTFWIRNEKGILEEHVLKNYRCTVTVGKDKDGVWKIAHIHGSLPDARTLDNMSTPEVRSKL
ncbi:ketosteroid isomerase-like protein [Oxalobacteraceae bacterium GrIS 2.11]